MMPRDDVIKRLFFLCLSLSVALPLTALSEATALSEKTALSGKKRILLPDGSTYIGETDQNGLLTGSGTLTWKSGSRYEGEFHAGVINGQGVFTRENGLRYEGSWQDGLWHGDGIAHYPDGSIFDGTFVRGEIEGQGTWTVTDQYEYTGDVKRGGKFHGEGYISYTDGGSYEGGFNNGKYHGDGLFTTESGFLYEGDFLEGEFTGEGTTTKPDGETYSGTFKNWRLNGEGTYTTTTGTHYEGGFEHGYFQGQGTYTSDEGVHYEGQFDSGYFDGEGVLTSTDGSIYVGGFSTGKKHGSGKLTYAEPLDGIKEIQGEWRYGNLIDGGDSLTIYKPEVVSEHFLYHQAASLKKAIAAIQPGNNETELFFLGIAGWGTEEVFRREISAIDSLMQAEFGTTGHRLLLVNSRRNIKDAPMATITSIRQSIMGLADRMNVEDDILMVFMTSHGSAETGLNLSHAGIRLEDLSPDLLRDMLDAAGIVHRVIIVSACYAGVFIEALANDNTLIMTAAAPDKTSFGCSDDSEMTYFGKALINIGIPNTDNFVDAFDQAADQVEKWEAEQSLGASLPQIHSETPIEEKLQQWRDGLD